MSNINNFNLPEEIESIKEFRKINKGKAVSTTHTYNKENYLKIVAHLFKRYENFNVRYNYLNIKSGKDEIEVTIPYYRNKL